RSLIRSIQPLRALSPHALFCLIPPPLRSTLFPYTTLFRSFFPRHHRGPAAKLSRRSAAAAGPLGQLDAASCGIRRPPSPPAPARSEEHTSELQSHLNLVCRLLLEKKKPASPIADLSLTDHS